MAAVSALRAAPTKLAALFSALLDLEFSPSCALYSSTSPDAEQAVRAFAACMSDQVYLDEYQTRFGTCVALCRKDNHRRICQVYVDAPMVKVPSRVKERWDELLRMEPMLADLTAQWDNAQLVGAMKHVASVSVEDARAWARMVATRGGAK